MQSGDESGGKVTGSRSQDWWRNLFTRYSRKKENRWLPPAAEKKSGRGGAQGNDSRVRRLGQQFLLYIATVSAPARDGGVALHGHVEAEVEHFGVCFDGGAFEEPLVELIGELAELLAGGFVA